LTRIEWKQQCNPALAKQFEQWMDGAAKMSMTMMVKETAG